MNNDTQAWRQSLTQLPDECEVPVHSLAHKERKEKKRLRFSALTKEKPEDGIHWASL
jgi:hypothetical protein